MNVKRISGGVAIAVTGVLSNTEALALADRLYALAGAEDAEIIDYPEADYPEADREASRADFLIKQRKEEADMAERAS